MDNQNSNATPITPLPPLQPLQPTPVPMNKGFAFDAPKPVVGEDLIASVRVEMPTPATTPMQTPISTPNAVSSSTLSSFSDFKPVNNFNTANTQSSQSQLPSGRLTDSRFSKKTVIGIVVIVILLLLAGGLVFAYPTIKPSIEKLFSSFGMMKVAPAGMLNQDLIPQGQVVPAEAQPEQTISDQYITSSPTLNNVVPTTQTDSAPVKSPAPFPKSGIGPEDEGPL